MSIITKPSVSKGTPAEFSLNKTDLAAVASVAADAYYSQVSNWKSVILFYKSSTNKQKKLVEFNATVSSPVANFLASLNASDIFQIKKIIIKDFDNGSFEVPRSTLTTAEFDAAFDVDLAPTPSPFDFFSTPNPLIVNSLGTVNVENQNAFAIDTDIVRNGDNYDYTFTVTGLNPTDCFIIGMSKSATSIDYYSQNLAFGIVPSGGPSNPLLLGRFSAEPYISFMRANAGGRSIGDANFRNWMDQVSYSKVYTFRLVSSPSVGLTLTISDGTATYTEYFSQLSDYSGPVFPFIAFPTAGNVCTLVVDNLL